MIHIDEKLYFYAVLIIPFLLLIFLSLRVWKRKARKQFAEKSMLKRLAPDRSSFKPWIRFGLMSVILLMIIIALANPKIGTKLETVKREGVDIVFAIDVSKSMLAEDIKPDRLEKAKRVVSELINHLKGDRIGIVAYAGQAFPQLPLTTDYASAKMFLQSINTDMLSSQGTAIQDAIRLASSYYDDNQPTSRLLFIISDGEDHGMGASEIAQEATNKGIKIYTIGVGTPKGGPIPIKENGKVISYKKDRQGETVITQLNAQLLEEIAQNGGGVYLNGDNTKAVVDKVEEILKGVEKSEFETQKMVDYKDQFQWFLAVAIILLFLDVFITNRKTAWIQKLNLFNEKEK